MPASRILLWVLGVVVFGSAWADSNRSVYEAHRALILRERFVVIDGFAFSVAEARNKGRIANDHIAFEKARLRAMANLSYARYEGTDWPQRITRAGIQRLRVRHLGLTREHFTVSGVEVLEQYVDASGDYVVVIGVDREQLTSKPVRFEQLRTDLIVAAERYLRDWELALLALEVADDPHIQIVLDWLLEVLAKRFHDNYRLLSQGNVEQVTVPREVDPDALDDQWMQNLSLTHLLTLYGLLPFHARVAHRLGNVLDQQGYRRAAVWAQYTGTLEQWPGSDHEFNLHSLSGDSVLLSHLRRRYGSVQ